MRWIMPSPQFPNVTSHGVLNHDKLAEQLHNISLETTNYDIPGRLGVLSDNSQHGPVFGDLNNPMQLSTSESAGQVGFHGSDHSISARN